MDHTEQNLRKIIPPFLLTIGAAGLLLFPFVIHILLFTTENYLSPDGQLESTTKYFIQVCYLFMAVECLVIGFAFQISNKIWGKFAQIFLYDPAFSQENRIKLSVAVFLSSTLIGMTICMLFYQRHVPGIARLFEEDQLLETATSVGLGLSTIILTWAVCTFRKTIKLSRLMKTINLSLGFLAFFLFFIAMEEISWGQRIFGWQTPANLFAGNAQNETNFHNFLNPYLYLIDWSFALMLFGIGMFSIFFYSRKKHNMWSVILLPHPSLTSIFTLIALPFSRSELLEELTSILFFYISLRIALIARDSRSGKTLLPGFYQS